MPMHTTRMLALATVGIAVSLPATALAQQSDPLAQQRADLDRRYAVGPTAAGELGYRITWQATIDTRGGELLDVKVEGNDVYAIAPGNRMTRIDREDGNEIWTSTVADFQDKVWGVTAGRSSASSNTTGNSSADPEKIYVTTDPVVMVVDYASGGIVGRQDLERIPSTEVLAFNQYLVFGTHSGQIVWHQYQVGHAWRANQLKGPILSQPVRVGDNEIAAASMGGTIVNLDGRTARRVWADKLFDSVSAPLATGDNMVYAASKDQYLWAFDASSGKTRWRYFTERPLETPPASIPGSVLQWVPGEGMVCLEADPGDSVEGVVRWKIADLKGLVIGMIRDEVAVFDPTTRTLHLVNNEQGAVTKSVVLDQVLNIEIISGHIYITGDGGRVQRLDPIG